MLTQHHTPRDLNSARILVPFKLQPGARGRLVSRSKTRARHSAGNWDLDRIPRGRYRSKFALPEEARPTLTLLKRLGLRLAWLARSLGVPAWVFYNRTDHQYRRRYRKRVPPPKQNS